MARRRRITIVLATTLFALVGCELIVDTSGLSGGPLPPDGAAPEAAAGDASSADVTATDATVDAGADADAAVTCPNKDGPAMVVVSAPGVAPFCIDSTEVTNGQFADFLSTSPSVSKLAPICTWKTSFNGPGGDNTLAINNIDWCDAFAYCNWAGKRLCGKIGGGSGSFDDFDDATKSQWYFVCSANDTQAYPYGATWSPGRCNDAEHDAGNILPPKSAPDCQGGFPGVYDMSGNVWEWEDACTTDAGVPDPQDKCRVRGGSWVDGDPTVRCDFDYEQHFDVQRGSPNGYTGFRCCADP